MIFKPEEALEAYQRAVKEYGRKKPGPGAGVAGQPLHGAGPESEALLNWQSALQTFRDLGRPEQVEALEQVLGKRPALTRR